MKITAILSFVQFAFSIPSQPIKSLPNELLTSITSRLDIQDSANFSLAFNHSSSREYMRITNEIARKCRRPTRNLLFNIVPYDSALSGETLRLSWNSSCISALDGYLTHIQFAPIKFSLPNIEVYVDLDGSHSNAEIDESLDKLKRLQGSPAFSKIELLLSPFFTENNTAYIMQRTMQMNISISKFADISCQYLVNVMQSTNIKIYRAGGFNTLLNIESFPSSIISVEDNDFFPIASKLTIFPSIVPIDYRTQITEYETFAEKFDHIHLQMRLNEFTGVYIPNLATTTWLRTLLSKSVKITIQDLWTNFLWVLFFS